MKMLNLSQAEPIENPPGVVRRTMAYNEEAMLCHFRLDKGARIPLHSHRASQIGYIIRGRARFLAEKSEDEFEVDAGDSYVFGPHVKHGTVALENGEYVEVFVPAREEYKDFLVKAGWNAQPEESS